MLLWLAMLFITTVDVAHVLGRTVAYADAGLGAAERADERRALIAGIVGIIDGYLITAVLLVFTLGLYRQFVSRPEAGLRGTPRRCCSTSRASTTSRVSSPGWSC